MKKCFTAEKNNDVYTQQSKFISQSQNDSDKKSDNETAEKPKQEVGHMSLSNGSETKEREKTTRSSNKIVCFYCKMPGHVISSCRKRLAKESANMSSHVNLIEKRPEIENSWKCEVVIDPGYREYCFTATLVKPDLSHKNITLLRDTGALQSLVSKQAVSESDYVTTDEFRLIQGVSGNSIRVPLVEMTFSGNRVTGTFLLGLIDKLPDGVHGLMGNDMCDVKTCDVLAVTRAQSRAAAAATQQQTDTKNDHSVVVNKNCQSNDNVVTNVDSNIIDSDLYISQLWNDNISVDKQSLIALQQADPKLIPLIERVKAVQYGDHANDSNNDCSEYFIKDGVLMRSYLNKSLPVGDGTTI